MNAEQERDWLARVYLEEADPNLVRAARDFFGAMVAKLGRKHADGRRGWAAEDDSSWTPETIRQHMLNHINKGDPVDVANFALFLWYHERRMAREAEEARGFDRAGCEAAIDKSFTEEDEATVRCADCGEAWKVSLELSACPKCYPVGSTR